MLEPATKFIAGCVPTNTLFKYNLLEGTTLDNIVLNVVACVSLFCKFSKGIKLLRGITLERGNCGIVIVVICIYL
jgi:hypothetical protein